MKNLVKSILLVFVAIILIALALQKFVCAIYTLVFAILFAIASTTDKIITTIYDVTFGAFFKGLLLIAVLSTATYVLLAKSYLSIHQTWIIASGTIFTIACFWQSEIREWFFPSNPPHIDERSLRNIFYDPDIQEEVNLTEENQEIHLAPLPKCLANASKDNNSFQAFVTKSLQANLQANLAHLNSTQAFSQEIQKVPDNLNKLSVRQLQCICDRLNRILPKTITKYRTKKTNKRQLVYKITRLKQQYA